MTSIREVLMLGALASTVIAIPILFAVDEYQQSRGWQARSPARTCPAGYFLDQLGTCRQAPSGLAAKLDPGLIPPDAGKTAPHLGPSNPREPAGTAEGNGNALSSIGVWADPSTAEIAAAEILSHVEALLSEEPMKTGSLNPDDLVPSGDDAGPNLDRRDDTAGSPGLTAPVASHDGGAVTPGRTHLPEPERIADSDMTPSQEHPGTLIEARDPTSPTPPPAIVDHVQQANLQPPGPPKREAWVTAAKESESKSLAHAYLRSWSSGNDEALADLDDFFGPRVNYFGRSVDLQTLVQTKRRFAERWPVRKYRHRPGTMSVRCDSQSERCTVRSVVDWEAASPARRARSNGSLRFELVLDMSGSRPVVRSENAQRLASLSKPSPPKSVPARVRPDKQEVKARSLRLPRALLPDDILLEEVPVDVW